MREEEAEIKFWEDIKNTNVKQTKKKNWNAEEEDEDVLEKLSGQKLTTNDISSVPVAGQVPVKSVNKGKGKATQPDSDHLNRGKQDDRASRKQENSNKSEESSQSTDKKKPKTKTFDRHRQKDRSMKKLGQFVPN